MTKDDWVKHCPVYKQEESKRDEEILKLVDVNALIKHLDTTMYRDVIEEIKNFPSVTPVIARQVNGAVLLIPTHTFEDIRNGTISSIEIRGEKEKEKEKLQGEWQKISLKTLNGDDIVAYECSCCRAIADKKYKSCPKCDAKMKGAMKNEFN